MPEVANGWNAHCKEYRKAVGKVPSGDLYAIVLVVSIEDHPELNHAEYCVRLGQKDGHSEISLSSFLPIVLRTITPTDKDWQKNCRLNLAAEGFGDAPYMEYPITVRWKPKRLLV
ncbi:MAG: hypothetical protein A3A80_04395 [Candidatus Terrybacteria bacterium RIFCSPLOWO2_01_FULL_44_24]|uniref:Uncharacterized protein n=1 Tax=Candidatus Terrybacteria bacterium RIFCSPHIGHO2_01_FULL_43_35 TaxID=1802361 RepID=A0A1G2PC30_9BACT|nr:MAG: hypothetical protein A2828_01270 [Candidatus Terrybacteria bacterium RIFCSPHIGHO2_01_FULL_43_35]OHA49660.1 MAG: hypothetical protein A3B75_01050 [Candidatus Terrybacteria bacterium RIFCSPHIGHO2_02_FULL_43_14]OHA51325.1 MAG: hypothetical protein A3A80_04395 [Candidatus Terrybacteria bacterium RIFCSPLOWO2_01_FULL_44_24]